MWYRYIRQWSTATVLMLYDIVVAAHTHGSSTARIFTVCVHCQMEIFTRCSFARTRKKIDVQKDRIGARTHNMHREREIRAHFTHTHMETAWATTKPKVQHETESATWLRCDRKRMSDTPNPKWNGWRNTHEIKREKHTPATHQKVKRSQKPLHMFIFRSIEKRVLFPLAKTIRLSFLRADQHKWQRIYVAIVSTTLHIVVAVLLLTRFYLHVYFCVSFSLSLFFTFLFLLCMIWSWSSSTTAHTRKYSTIHTEWKP